MPDGSGFAPKIVSFEDAFPPDAAPPRAPRIVSFEDAFAPATQAPPVAPPPRQQAPEIAAEQGMPPQSQTPQPGSTGDLGGSVSRIAQAFLAGGKAGWQGSQPFLTPQAQAALDQAQQQGGVTGALAKLGSILSDDYKLNFAARDAVLGAVQAAVAQAGTELGSEQAGRDIAAMPEAFMGMPGALRVGAGPMPAEPRARVEPTFGGTSAGAPPDPEVPGGPRPGAPGTPALPAPPRLLTFEQAMGDAPPDSTPPPDAPPVAPASAEAPPEGGGAVAVPDSLRAAMANYKTALDAYTAKWDRFEQAKLTPSQREEAHADWERIGDAARVMGAERSAFEASLRAARADQPGGTAAPPPPELLNTASTAAPPVSTVPAPEAAPSVESATPAPVESSPAQVAAHGGPWTSTGKRNHMGDEVYENGNGVRAIMENGVPWTESVRMDPERGMVPRNPGDRKKQFLVEGEDFGERKPTSAPEKPKPDWTLLGTNADGLPVYTNPQGVHSVVENGTRDVESVRLRPTPGGMAMEVPGAGEKDARFRVAKADETPKPEAAPAKVPTTPKNNGGIADRIARMAKQMGFGVTRESSNISGSEYLNLSHDALPDQTLKVRVSNHDLPLTYGRPGDYDVHSGPPRQQSSDWADVVQHLAQRIGAKPPAEVAREMTKRAAADMAQRAESRRSPVYQEGILERTYPKEWAAAIAMQGSARSAARRALAARYEAAHPDDLQWAPYLRPRPEDTLPHVGQPQTAPQPQTLNLIHGHNPANGPLESFAEQAPPGAARYDDGEGVFGPNGVYLAENGKWVSGDNGPLGFREPYLTRAKFDNPLVLTPQTEGAVIKRLGSTDPREIADKARDAGYDGIIVQGYDAAQGSSAPPALDLQDQVFAMRPKNVSVTRPMDDAEIPEISPEWREARQRARALMATPPGSAAPERLPEVAPAAPVGQRPMDVDAFRGSLEKTGAALKDGSWRIIPRTQDTFGVERVEPKGARSIFEAPEGESGWTLEQARDEAARRAFPASATKPTEHPGLVITSLETGKTTKIQPIGTVPPAQNDAAEAPAKPRPLERIMQDENVDEWGAKAIQAAEERAAQPDSERLFDEAQALMRKLPRDMGKAKREGKLTPAQQKMIDRLDEIEKLLPSTSPEWKRIADERTANAQEKYAAAAEKNATEQREKLANAGFTEGDRVYTIQRSFLPHIPGKRIEGVVKIAKDGTAYVSAQGQRLDPFSNPWQKAEGPPTPDVDLPATQPANTPPPEPERPWADTGGDPTARRLFAEQKAEQKDRMNRAAWGWINRELPPPAPVRK